MNRLFNYLRAKYPVVPQGCIFFINEIFRTEDLCRVMAVRTNDVRTGNRTGLIVSQHFS